MAGTHRLRGGGAHSGRGGQVNTAPLPAHHCPLCGQPNQCAPARAGTFEVACWCSALRVDPAILRQDGAVQERLACLCQRCLGAAPAPVADP